MPSTLLFHRGAKTVEAPSVADLTAPVADGSVLWIGLGPGETEGLVPLARRLGLPDEAVHDLLSPGRRMRLWRHGPDTALTGHLLVPREDGTSFARLSLLLFGDVLLTLWDDDHADPRPFLTDAADSPLLSRYGAAALLHTLLENTAAGYHEMALDIDERIDDVEELLFERDRPRSTLVQQRSYELRKRLTLLRRAMLPIQRALVGLSSSSAPAAVRDMERHYREVTLQLDATSDLMEALREMLASLLSADLNLQQKQLNVTMKKLTGWAAVIAVPTAVTSWYGMNVALPGQFALWGAYLANAVLVVSALLVYVSFRRRDWL
ncbi:magnesium transporter CorA family protein [Marinactinospora thermotolerans]|uniref:Magnesium transporter n=1 Tax=Marinactinospora thermotolerans DSM 45154 TaxID=1122192 RepID=A0A1T4K959_9ACTN|nr:CorA family divalent cation transporter [Marinactinospora thermotolerans]SJZ38843.1 magnesium transporter [Marinactinospora thermotolerans DSM 45154]